MKARIVVDAMCAVLLTTWAFSQNTGKIVGKVTDASTGEALIGANIVVEGTRLGAVTDLEGQYLILQVPSGLYSVAASYLGYTKTIVTNVQVLSDLTTTLDFKCAQSAITLKEEVVITAETPMIKKDLTATESRVTSQEIENLPLQDLSQLVTQQAGVSKDAGGGIHLRGGRSTEIAYLVNGISITDDYSRSQALEIQTESVQELQVISGTFNAEYGNAMSGVINIVTKTGGVNYHASVEAWTGDYISSHKDLFWGIDRLSPTANYNLQGTLSGPLFSDRATFFVTARRNSNDGFLYGVNAYVPQGRNVRGDSSFVSMNADARWTGQATFDWQISGAIKLKVDAFGSQGTSRSFSQLFRLDPNGIGTTRNSGMSVIGRLTHQLWENTFHELTVASKLNRSTYRLYDDPYDPRYVHPDSLNVPGYHYRVAGTDLNRFERSTNSTIVKWELTSQIDRYDLGKMGVEAQLDKVVYENITLVPAKNAFGREIVPFVPSIEGLDSPNHDKFSRTPFKFAAYIQDKIELKSMIINAGVRFELFDPHGQVPTDPEDPDIYHPLKPLHTYHDLNNDGQIGLDEEVESNALTFAEREAFWYRKVDRKVSVSPRLGIAYPITDQGIIRFSYGIFEQVPEYSELYLGDQYKLVTAQAGLQGPFGNNDLKPQRTTIYELGLQQQLTEDFAIDVTAFYRDIRNWISSSQPIPTFLGGLSYSKRINRDFANVRGVTLSVNRRLANNFSFGVDYTFQVAEGTNSSPDQEFFAQQNGSEPTKSLAPLGWDQTHTLNANIFLGSHEQGISLIASLNSGQPYTPTLITGAYTGRNVLPGLLQNSRRKPFIARLDLEMFKNIAFVGVGFQVFLRVFNLLDSKNPIDVYGDTGRADFTLQEVQITGYDPGWFNLPTMYSEPRSVYLGTKISL